MELITPYLLHIALVAGSTLLTAYLAKNHVNGTQYPFLSALFDAGGLSRGTEPKSTGHPLLDALRALLNHPDVKPEDVLTIVKSIVK